jgi:amidase
MMRVIKRDQIIYQFSPENKPVAQMKPGETIIVETDDCFKSQIKSEKDLVTEIDFSRVNPATGPVEVEGAKPGDILVVDIQDIELGETGFMVTIPGEGAFGARITHPKTKVVPVSESTFRFNASLSFPVHPMIGVIGVSPEDEAVPCGEIGDHGGNMDAKVITSGATLYFKVRREGGMIALGDVHAGMGDGEAVICGVEITARVRMKLELIRSPAFVPKRPVVEYNDLCVTIGHGASLDEAAHVALVDMLELLRYKTGMEEDEISMLISAVGELKVCQIVDPQKTARVEMPKAVLPDPAAFVFP